MLKLIEINKIIHESQKQALESLFDSLVFFRQFFLR